MARAAVRLMDYTSKGAALLVKVWLAKCNAPYDERLMGHVCATGRAALRLTPIKGELQCRLKLAKKTHNKCTIDVNHNPMHIPARAEQGTAVGLLLSQHACTGRAGWNCWHN